MITLIFSLTVLTILVLSIRIITGLIKGKSISPTLKVMGLLIMAYGIAWLGFHLTQKLVPVSLGTQICFDDWCATVVKVEKQAAGDSIVFFLHIQMHNHARGIAQTPSEPRVHILDSGGRTWAYSVKRQLDFEKRKGKQPGIGHRLELQQSAETTLVFSIPKTATGLKALIEEGPWLTNLLFPGNEDVFPLE